MTRRTRDHACAHPHTMAHATRPSPTKTNTTPVMVWTVYMTGS